MTASTLPSKHLDEMTVSRRQKQRPESGDYQPPGPLQEECWEAKTTTAKEAIRWLKLGIMMSAAVVVSAMLVMSLNLAYRQINCMIRNRNGMVCGKYQECEPVNEDFESYKMADATFEQLQQAAQAHFSSMASKFPAGQLWDDELEELAEFEFTVNEKPVDYKQFEVDAGDGLDGRNAGGQEAIGPIPEFKSRGWDLRLIK